MKTALSRLEIKAKYNFGCLNYYLALHENGHIEEVLLFLQTGDSTLGKSGYTYNALKKSVCNCVGKEFNDSQGVYAGTFVEWYYNGTLVDKATNYSLFN